MLCVLLSSLSRVVAKLEQAMVSLPPFRFAHSPLDYIKEITKDYVGNAAAHSAAL